VKISGIMGGDERTLNQLFTPLYELSSEKSAAIPAELLETAIDSFTTISPGEIELQSSLHRSLSELCSSVS
jgi:hypothetical protein